VEVRAVGRVVAATAEAMEVVAKGVVMGGVARVVAKGAVMGGVARAAGRAAAAARAVRWRCDRRWRTAP
jgi:hypothetical protein